MRFSDLFAALPVAAAMLLTGAAAEAQQVKPIKTTLTAQGTCPDPNHPNWGTATDVNGRTVCVPPGLTGRFPRDVASGNFFPPGLRGVAPPGWPISPQ
jgi:hypothetical protein